MILHILEFGCLGVVLNYYYETSKCWNSECHKDNGVLVLITAIIITMNNLIILNTTNYDDAKLKFYYRY